LDHFTAHRLTFVAEALDRIELNEHQGSALRGALYHALRTRFCAFGHDRQAQCSTCTLAATCPVATLAATLAPGHPRGQDRPRPYTIQPPLPGSGHPVQSYSGRLVFQYEPGETLTFGLTLYAQAMHLFPYVVLATQAFETGGLGRLYRQDDGRRRRGRLQVREIWAHNPLTGERQIVLRSGTNTVHVPDVPVTHAQVLEACQEMNGGGHGAPVQLTLRFLTPTRLIHKGRLIKPEGFAFRPFFQRLLERLEALSGAFSDTPLPVSFPDLLDAAARVTVVDHSLTWEEVRSYSTRRQAESPIGGLLGQVVLETHDWSPFLPWLLWGQFVHVGKDAVKGNGWYRLRPGGRDATH